MVLLPYAWMILTLLLDGAAKLSDAISGIGGGKETQSLPPPAFHAAISLTNIHSKSFPLPAKQQPGLKTWKL